MGESREWAAQPPPAHAVRASLCHVQWLDDHVPGTRRILVRAVRLYGVGQLKFENVAGERAGTLAADSVRVRVQAVGICGSDLHNYRTGQWITRVPSIPGHEFAGEVVAVGSGVTRFKVGDGVVADSRVVCGACPACLEHRGNVCENLGYVGEVCDGGLAEFVMLPEAQLLRVPPGIPPHIAALAEPLGVALHVVRRLAPRLGEPVLIVGAGPIGGLAALILKHLGFGPLLVLDNNVARATLVASLSDAAVVNADPDAIVRQVAPQRLRFGIEATGSSGGLSLLLKSLAGGGRLAMVGLYKGEPSVDLNRVVEGEIDIVGCSVFCDEQREALGLLEPLQGQLEKVITAPIELENVPAAYDRLLLGNSPALKTIVCP